MVGLSSFQVEQGAQHQTLNHFTGSGRFCRAHILIFLHITALKCFQPSRAVVLRTHNTDFGLLAGARRADQSLQLISDALIVIQNLSQLLHKVLSLSRVRQVPCSNTEFEAVTHHRSDDV